MKKLMITAAIVCAAVVSQAATCNWKSGVIADHTGTDLSAAGQVTAYAFEIGSTDFDAYSKMTSAELSDALWKEYGTQLDKADGFKANVKKNSAANISAIDVDAGKSAYAALIYVDAREGVGKEWFMGNVAEIAYSGVGDPEASGLALFRNGVETGAATAWAQADVPEPTSGLLLLLGMAGLALRRRRA